MTRAVALRAFFIFLALTVLAAITGVASQAAVAEVVFLVGVSLSAVLLFFAITVPARQPVPVRIRRRF